MLRIAQIVPLTLSEGPGVRMAIWLQGCPLRCPGCCNPEMLPFEGGEFVPWESLLAAACESQTQGAEGITLLGGEPTSQAENGAANLAAAVQERGMSVMLFSGFTLAELKAQARPAVDRLLRHVDILVDGPYLREAPEPSRRWIGSANQQVHFLTDRYAAADPCWQAANTLEIRFQDGVLAVNGFPAPQAQAIWRRPQKVIREPSEELQ